MATPKKTTSKKVDPWADVTPVASTATPEKVAATATDEGSPFGSMTPLMKLIDGFRINFIQRPVERRGRATAPDGTVYGYYLTEDVLARVYQYCYGHGGFLDIGMEIDDQANNIMVMSLTDTLSGDTKVVKANLGKPQSSSDFGSRTTYVPKYLVSIMFGVSIQTDSDAFNNGKTIDNEPRNNEPVVNSPVRHPDGSGTHPSGETTSVTSGGAVPTSPNPGSNPVDSSGSREGQSGAGPVGQTGAVAHSQSYPVAKQFIERALNHAMLDVAESKVVNAKQLLDFERAELFVLIQDKRNQLKSANPA